MATAQASYLLTGFLLFPVIYGLRSYRWHILTHATGASYSLFDSVRIYCSSIFLGIVTPGKIGEMAKVPSLTTHNIPLGKSIALCIGDRVLDIVVLGPLAISSIAILFREHAITVIVTLSLMAMGVLIALWKRSKLEEVFQVFGSLMFSTIVPVFILTIGNWFVFFVQMVIFAHAFGITLALAPLVAVLTLVSIISVLPIAPAGLGTRDAAMLYFLLPYGFSTVQIVAFSSTVFVLTVSASLIGCYFWLQFPTKTNAS